MDGLSAWEKYQVERPDLVVLEAILPRLHGFDLTKRIVQDSGGGVPVIIITGLYRGPQYRHEALTSFGAAEYMEKPVDEARLLQAAQDLLREKVDVGWNSDPGRDRGLPAQASGRAAQSLSRPVSWPTND